MTKIRNWCFVDGYENLTKPKVDVNKPIMEQAGLFGYVYQDKRKDPLTGEFSDGHRITTSPVLEINLEERYVKTKSGSLYVLDGEMNAKYKEWLKNGCEVVNAFEIIPRLYN